MIAAFAYLTARSAYNKVRGQLLRLRNPRYAIAIGLGLFYFYFVFFQRSPTQDRGTGPLSSTVIEIAAAVLGFLYVAYVWVAGSDRSALAFSQAEVSLLFPAPVSRRGLIVYKLVRSQVGVLTTSLIWYVMFRRPGLGLERVISSWVMLSAFSLHRLGAALVHASSFEHGAKGWRRSWLPVSVFGAALALVLKGVYDAKVAFSASDGGRDLADVLGASFSEGPVRWVLWPFRAVIAPMFTSGPGEWLPVIWPALLILAIHFAWVLASDAAFEEAAAEASTARARRLETLRTRGVAGAGVTAKSARRTIPLAPTGPAALALVWKNLLWLVRSGQVRSLILLPLIAAAAMAVFASRSPTAELLVAIMSFTVAAMTLVFGPMTMRNDLRGELRRLPFLKTLPLPGREILLAEVASSSIPTALMQYGLVAVGFLALGFAGVGSVTPGMRIGALVGAPFFLAGLSLANFTLHNALALLFPGWVRLGETGAAGVELMGQMMLATILTLTMLALMLLLPALAAAVVYVTLRLPAGLAVASSAIVAGVALAAETYLLINVLGKSLDRLEPMQVG